jgi:protein TonB
MRVLPVLGGKSFGVKAATLAVSVSVHAAVAFVAAHGDGAPAPVEGRLVEWPAPELVTIETSQPETLPEQPMAPARAHHRAGHHHPYAVAADHDATPHDPALPHLPLLGRDADRHPALAPAVLEEPPSVPARFVLTVGAAATTPGGAVSTSGNSGGTQPTAAPLSEEGVDSAATLVAGRAPAYTLEAQSAGVEADVPLEIVVDDRGIVVAARAVRRVGYGLDDVALRSVRGYRFEPARRAGHPVAVRMRWVMRFELR